MTYLTVFTFEFLIPAIPVKVLKSDTPPGGFSLKTGDLLVRPNWNWVPGSSTASGGRTYGHVAIVVQGAEGKSVREALRKAVVIEALLFDQRTRKFIFGSKEIVRKTSAYTSFGERFVGRRYLLRMNLPPAQQHALVQFLYCQLKDDSYTIFSFKKKSGFPPGSIKAFHPADQHKWNCATLAWYAFQYATGKDIDSNSGILIFPNDIVRSHYFDSPEKRVRF